MIARTLLTSLFLLAGGLLFLGQRLLQPAPAVGQPLSPLASTVDVDPQAALLWEAERRGLPARDPIVRDRLVRNMRFVEPDTEESDEALFERAMALGMHRSDPIARAELCERVTDLLLAEAPLEEASAADLQGYVDAHPERFWVGDRVAFRQLLFRAVPGSATARERALKALAALRGHGKQAAEGDGDPTLLPARMEASTRRVAGVFGEGFARSLGELPEGDWQGPVESSFGVHLVWVEQRVSGQLPALDEVREAARVERRHDLQQATRDRLLRVLSQRYASALGEAP